MLTMTTSPDHIAARHILECPLLADRTAPYIREDEIDWPGMFNDIVPFMCHSERLLIDVAHDLFGGFAVTSLREIVTITDGENFNVICEAMLGLRRLLLGCDFEA